MPHWLGGQVDVLGETVAKAALMYLVALAGLRLAQRRTLSQWTAIDFAASVAVGAILGRTIVATSESFLVGATALLSLLIAHTIVTYLRFFPWVSTLTDHRVRVLVAHGELRQREMRRSGLTESDLLGHLRLDGVGDLAQVRYVLYETKGELTVVQEDGAADSDIVRRGLQDAADYPSDG